MPMPVAPALNPDGAPAGDFDVVIVGGGPAGCATALALAERSLRVLLVEAGRYRTARVGESIPPDTSTVLQALGIWDDFVREGHARRLGSCSSWGDDALGFSDFLFNPLGYGWHLQRQRFDVFLARKAAERGCAVRQGTRLDGLERVANGFRLRLGGDDGAKHEVRARFVVDASGMRSCVSRSMGASRRFVDQLICVTAYFERAGSAGFSQLTMLEAVEYGWWYAARLPSDRIAVAVASDADIVKRKALRHRDGFVAELDRTRHLAPQLAGWRFVEGSQMISAAPSFVLDEVGGNGWLAVGDAASAYDPISSQGIHKALSDGVQAAQAVADFLQGNSRALGDYRAAMAPRFQGYLQGRNFFYGLEKRWPASPFWTTRQARIAVSKEPVLA
jgi:flavin-dependent dehydrogenase